MTAKVFDTAILNKAKGIGWSNFRAGWNLLKGKLDGNSAVGKGLPY